MPTPASRYQDRLEGLSAVTAARLVRLWGIVIAAGGGEDQWIRAARPIITGAATTAVNLSATYATISARQYATGTPSRLIVPDAAAHVHEPLLVVSKGLGDGLTWSEATQAANSTVNALGHDSVMGPGRQALAERLPYVRAVRRLDSGACEWCVSISGVIWPSVDAASFGHSECHCTPTPITGPASLVEVGDHNQARRTAAGWDDQKAANYKVRDQIKRLRESEANATARSRAAAAEARTETDPDRLERLSIREQDWETRAERAAERRRILETGTHQLAA